MIYDSDLSIPLLGNLPRREREQGRDEQDAQDDEEVCMRGSKSIAPNNSQEESQHDI
jgi:hypothetical protein